ncbi:MAG: C-GCAxxG-C-C family protein [Acidobacteriota bacterium]
MEKNRIDRALALFAAGYNCAQAIFTAYAAGEEIPERLALSLPSAFGGGIARMGETCGAVSGSFMVIGRHAGRLEKDPLMIKECAYAMVEEFVDAFAARHGSIRCRDLLGYDLSNPADYARVKAEDVIGQRCPAFVRSAAEVLESVLGL